MQPANFNQTHSAWTQVLKRYVTEDGSRSYVNYAGIRQHPEDLNSYLSRTESVTSDQFARMNKSERLAFLINAYNALTVKLIVDHYPLKSIRDIGGIFSSPWKLKFFTLLGGRHSLDDIEHEMIRKKFVLSEDKRSNDPRIHFALVCASKGCPALRNEAYTGSRLNEQLDDAANTFLRDPLRNRYMAGEQALFLSSIFKWYGNDFAKKYGSVQNFVAEKMSSDPAIRTAIKSAKTIRYLDYDWSLNSEP